MKARDENMILFKKWCVTPPRVNKLNKLENYDMFRST